MPFLRHYTDVAIVVLGLGLFPALAGCHGLGLGQAGTSARTAEKSTAPNIQSTEPDTLSADDRAVFAQVAEKDSQGREHCVWTRSVDPQSPFRWHYPKLDAVLAQPAEQRPDLKKLLGDRDLKVSCNAAIALGRLGDGQAVIPLTRAIQTPTLPLPMRCAAAEALGAASAPPSDESITSGTSPFAPRKSRPFGERKTPLDSSPSAKGVDTVAEIQKLLDKYGRCSPKPSASYVSELHGDLLRSLARRKDAADDPRFTAALRSPRAEVRLEALKAWAASKSHDLPIEATDLRTDGDARVRAASLEAMVLQRHPQALEYLKPALTDTDYTVRRAALAGLGKHGGDEALAVLKGQFKDRSDGVRSEVVKAFAAMHAEQSVMDAVSDKSWRVRLRAAEALTAFPSPAGAAAADKLLDDPSAEVQTAAVHALQSWPLERSGPILLAAMGRSVFLARKAAAGQLAERWPPAAKFSVDGPLDRRTKILEDLGAQFRGQFGAVQTAGIESSTARQHKRQAISPDTIEEVESVLAAGDIKALIAYGPDLIDVLEVLRFERKQTLPESLYRDVLPKLLPVFVALDHFTSRETAQRRSAARELQALTVKQSCGRLALDRLAQLMAAEADDLVWLSVLQAVWNENDREAAHLVYASLGQSSSEVRRRACTYLAEHPDRRHAAMLLPALEDPQPLVVCAALEALAAGGMDDPTPLKRLLNSSDKEIELAATVALTRLNDPSGKPALERLAYNHDPQIRARVARAMGESPDPAFIPLLIRDLSDQAAVAHAALAGLPHVVGKDISQPDSQPVATAERISRWKRWFERQERVE